MAMRSWMNVVVEGVLAEGESASIDVNCDFKLDDPIFGLDWIPDGIRNGFHR
jgi:hypothetical protein